MTTETTQVIIEGAGGHGKVVIECLLSQGRKIIALVDPKVNGILAGIKILNQYDASYFSEAGYVIAVGDNKTRQTASLRISHSFTNAIHSSAIVSASVAMGVGCMILHGSIVQAETQLGNHVIINTGAQVDHDNVIGDFVHIGPGSVLCGNVQVGIGTLVGSAAVIIPGVKIGKWATIGAGAIVTRDVPDFATVVGNPAKIIRMSDQ